MQGKSLVQFFLIAMALVCLYQLSFTWKASSVLNRFKSEAEAACVDNADPKCYNTELNIRKNSNETVYNLGILKYTYQGVVKRKLNLGLDLQGGMSVVLEVTPYDYLKELSGPHFESSTFLKTALNTARFGYKKGEGEFMDIFQDYWQANGENQKAVEFFAQRSSDIEFDMENKEVFEILREKFSGAIDLTFERLNSRIDKFGVTNPNISYQKNSGRILFELPGAENRDRIKAQLQAPAHLEFWPVWELQVDQRGDRAKQQRESQKVLQELLKLDDLARKAVEKNNLSSSAEETPAEEVPDLVGVDDDAPVINPDDPLAAAGDNALPEVDSPEVADDEDVSEDNPAESGPLLALLRKTELSQGATEVASVHYSDTAEVNRYLFSEEAQSALDKRIFFAWGFYPSSNNEDHYELYALQKRSALDNEAQLEGDAINSSRADQGSSGRGIEISMAMNSSGSKVWADMTGKNIGEGVAILMDGRVLSAPRVNDKIEGGNSVIYGNYSMQEAQDLSNMLNVGKLPVKPEIVQEEIVGPSLGEKSIAAGLNSLLIGMLLVLLFMIYYYGKAGIVAVVALLLNLFFIIGVLASMGASLTLPGIAGIVLTIGMSVDANVIIFERIREELRKGKGPKLALADGYKNSYSAILDANVTTLFIGFILATFGTGPIKGFAVVLIIGIFCSLFTGVLVTRLIFSWMQSKDWKVTYGNKMTLNAFKNINRQFVAKRKIAYMVSGAILLIGIGSMITRQFELGVDFKGGRSYVVKFDQSVSSGDVQKSLTAAFESAVPIVKTFGSDDQLKITTAYKIDAIDSGIDQLVFQKLYGGVKSFYQSPPSIEAFGNGETSEGVVVGMQSNTTVEPTIAKDMERSAVKVTLLSFVLIFVYIVFRFRKWQFGLGALAALVHDALVLMTVFSLFYGLLPFSLEVDQAFIAALLTVIGYSINDTVVVFDRIREYLGEKKSGEQNEIINKAINDNLSRTLITSFTTLLVLSILFVFGGEVIRGFSFAILLGVIVGTYSSIFIATPIVVDMAKKEVAKVKGGKKS